MIFRVKNRKGNASLTAHMRRMDGWFLSRATRPISHRVGPSVGPSHFTFFAFSSSLKVEKFRYEYFMVVSAPAPIITAPAQLVNATAQPPATGVVVYTALFFKKETKIHEALWRPYLPSNQLSNWIQTPARCFPCTVVASSQLFNILISGTNHSSGRVWRNGERSYPTQCSLSETDSIGGMRKTVVTHRRLHRVRCHFPRHGRRRYRRRRRYVVVVIVVVVVFVVIHMQTINHELWRG